MTKRKFIIAGGGTGGHIYPGIAIAKAIENQNPNIEVEFVGSSLGLENKIVPREGFVLHLLPAGKLNYKGSSFGKIIGLIRVFAGFLKALVLIIRLRPVGVLGVGGYASGPFVLAAALLRIPTSIWEPNAHPGMTNRLLSRIVPRSFVVFSDAQKQLFSSKIYEVGLPVRSELEIPSAAVLHREFNVLVFGGSQGAKAINQVVESSVNLESEWLRGASLVHQTGVTDYGRVKTSYDKSVFDVKTFEYLFEMDKYYTWADIVICRSGASTIAELCAVGKPSILVPLPTAADDHQRKNALALVSANAAIMIEQKDLTVERLNEVLRSLQKDPHRLAEMASNAKRLHKPKAAEAISAYLLGSDL